MIGYRLLDSFWIGTAPNPKDDESAETVVGLLGS